MTVDELFPSRRGYIRTLHRRLALALLALGRELRCEVEGCASPELFQPGELEVASRGGDDVEALFFAHRGCAHRAREPRPYQTGLEFAAWDELDPAVQRHLHDLGNEADGEWRWNGPARRWERREEVQSGS